MSDIVKTFVLLAILSVAIFLDVQINLYINQHKTQQIIEQQSIINQQLNDKINELQETVDYVEFSLGVNNKLLEEVLMEQIQKKGD